MRDETPRFWTQNYRQMLIMGAAIAAAIYSMKAYVGPCKWLAELQIRWFGAYEETITVLIVCLVLAAPLLSVDWLLRRARGRVEPSVNVDPAAPAPAWLRFFGWIGFGAVIAAIGLVFLALAAWHFRLGGEQQITRVEASAFENGTAPEARWVAVRGVSMFQTAASIKSSSSARTEYFVPLLSAEWNEGDPVAIYLKAREDDLNDDVRGSRMAVYEGMLRRRDLPGLARTEFENRGPAPANDYYVLKLNRTPRDERRVARDLLIFGVVLMLAGVITFIVQRRHDLFRSAALPPVPSGQPDPRFTIRSMHVPAGGATTSPPPALPTPSPPAPEPAKNSSG